MNNYLRLYYEKLQLYEEQIMEDLAELVSIPSIFDEKTITPYAPFGENVRNVFTNMLDICRRDSFSHADFDGYAIHIEYGEGKEIVGILAHLDIVSEGDKENWMFDPFILTEHDGYLYGRGVNDDKAPLLAAYYAMKIVRDLNIPFNRKVRLIIGGAEETTWECIDHYFKHNPRPIMGFSPDGDFPIVNGEKGVIQGTFTFVEGNQGTNKGAMTTLLAIESEQQRGFICERLKATFTSDHPENLKNLLCHAEEVTILNQIITVVYRGEKTLSRNPHKGENAFFKFAKDLIRLQDVISNTHEFSRLIENYFLEDVCGEKIGLYQEDLEMGTTTFGIPFVTYDGTTFEIAIDYRYPKGQTVDSALEKIQSFSRKHSWKFTSYKTQELLYVESNSKLIRTLQKAYKVVTGEDAELLTKGGISYARSLQNCVAFGPTFSGDHPNTHKPNERIRIKTLYKAIIIYCETLRLLVS
ncbi:Sapep family Mn(2+)-dependent dipeptidase [Neobacillus drentensis]|uniref:Sapep family Mn(2+)-dependent dipeptidase n=1 Tax=Neobacillus drentensis TaxID=220684 RepID=UPI002FFEC6D0